MANLGGHGGGHLAIPEFLLVENRGKWRRRRRSAKAGAPAPSEAPAGSGQPGLQALALLEPDLRAWVEAEVCAGRFRTHWLLDQSTMQYLKNEVLARVEAKRARQAEVFERLRNAEAAKPRMPVVPGYKGHKSGSRKARVHECFDEKGGKAALKLGKKLELKDSTVASWIKYWQKVGAK